MMSETAFEGMDAVEEEIRPETEPLTFTIDTTGMSEEMANMVVTIKNVAESILYKWSSFPIRLPDSISGLKMESTNLPRAATIKFQDLFKAPLFDELTEVALDENGEPRKLSENQLKSVRENGEFEVASLNFPGQAHKWRLSWLLQKGSNNTLDAFYDGVALSLRLIIVTAKNRIISNSFSISQGIKGLYKGGKILMNLLFGIPSLKTVNLDASLREHRQRFLIEELSIRPEQEGMWERYIHYLKIMEKQRHLGGSLSPTSKMPPIPYLFQRPDGTSVNLILYSQGIQVQIRPILEKITYEAAQGWQLRYHKQLLKEFSNRKDLTVEQIQEEIGETMMTEYLQRIYELLAANQEIEGICRGLGKLLIECVQATLIIDKVIANQEKELLAEVNEVEESIKKINPIRSRISDWINEQLHQIEEVYKASNEFRPHDDAIQKCMENSLPQAVYFLQRDKLFMKEIEPKLTEELKLETKPARYFSFKTRIWLPGNWLITKTEEKSSIKLSPTFRETRPQGHLDSNVVYRLEKNQRSVTNSGQLFWRWRNFANRIWSWTWNAIFFFLVYLAFFSPTSLRALLSIDYFHSDWDLSQVDGSLYPSEKSKTHSLISRINALWTHVFVSRTSFENKPDRGFLNKSVTRHFNRFWNYFIKGFLGTFLLVLIMPILCILTVLLSLALALTAPLWMPCVVVLSYFFMWLFYDFDAKRIRRFLYVPLFRALLWHIVLQGVVQPLLCIVFIVAILPTISFLILLFTVLIFGWRYAWDSVIFYILVKPKGRVPSQDGFIARRISGPGLAADYFYQITPSQCLAALELYIEQKELNHFEVGVNKLIEKPLEHYRTFVEKTMKPFSVDISHSGVYNQLYEESRKMKENLSHTITNRRNLLGSLGEVSQRGKIKMTTNNLRVTIAQSAAMLEKLYPSHVTKWTPMDELEFWNKKKLEPGDWTGLAVQVLKEIFSPAFLVPLEEADKYFRLEVEHVDLSRYAQMLETAQFTDDLDLVYEIHTPAGETHMESVSLPLAKFSPLNKESYTTIREKPWPQDKLVNPLLVPPASAVAVNFSEKLRTRGRDSAGRSFHYTISISPQELDLSFNSRRHGNLGQDQTLPATFTT